MRRLLLAVPLLFSVVACSAEQGEPVVLSKNMQPIAGGVNDSTHTSVFGLVLLSQGGFGECSGTLIAPNLILTARHCVAPTTGEYVVCGQSPFGNPYKASSLYATYEDRISQNAQYFQGAEVFVPEDGNDTCGFDVGLIRLSQNVPGSITEPYVPRVDQMVRRNEIYTAVGFGNTSDSGGAGTRRMRDGLIVQCDQGGSCGFGVSPSEWRGETGICSGDSGGPALDDQGRVIGVVSRGGQNCSTPVYGAVQHWGDWIREIALDAADKGGYEPASWVTTGSTQNGSGGSGGSGTAGAGGDGGSGGSGTAGASTGGSSSGTGVPQGFPCASSSECSSGACGQLSSESPAVCTNSCAESTECGAGFACSDSGYCFPEGQFTAGDAGSSTACSYSPPEKDPAKPVPWAVGALGLAMWLRRRRCSK
ncbi:MAG: S1 family peptidase [Polyangiaceae bacterium]